MNETFQRYLRRTISSELRPYRCGETMRYVSISEADRKSGSPKAGDMIARNPDNHSDMWLVEESYFKKHFEQNPS